MSALVEGHARHSIQAGFDMCQVQCVQCTILFAAFEFPLKSECFANSDLPGPQSAGQFRDTFRFDFLRHGSPSQRAVSGCGTGPSRSTDRPIRGSGCPFDKVSSRCLFFCPLRPSPPRIPWAPHNVCSAKAAPPRPMHCCRGWPTRGRASLISICSLALPRCTPASRPRRCSRSSAYSRASRTIRMRGP
jgi:hypothetical protein